MGILHFFCKASCKVLRTPFNMVSLPRFIRIGALFVTTYCINRKEIDMNDRDYMKLAIELAVKATGHTNPNPLVGAVIVKDNKIIGKGYHARHGSLHAERVALAECTQSPKGAAIYVTLEPCCHHGTQPPCTDALIENGIKRVIIGSRVPNPLVSGKGVRILRDHGIEVIEDFMREECDAINTIFFHYIQTERPYVTLKYAMTLDGKIATAAGASRWITGEKARENVHMDRNRHAAILVGIGTVLADDPLLNCRIEGGKDPVRIICDTHLRIPLDSQIVRTANEIPTIIAVGEDFMQEDSLTSKASSLQAAGIRILPLPLQNGCVDLNALTEALGKEKIDSIFIEGGSRIAWSALSCGIVNKIQSYIAPKIFGGQNAPGPVGGGGVKLPSEAFALGTPEIKLLDDDILIESEVIPCSQASSKK